MATAAVTYTFINGTNADGTQVNSNFSSVVNFLNSEVVQRDASVAFTTIPTLPAVDPTSDNHAVRKAYVDNFMPAGIITQYGGSTAPTGWLLCNGAPISRSNSLYARLWNAIGINYGGGDGTTTFNVPNLQGKFPIGMDSVQTEFDALGETGGDKTSQLVLTNLPDHTHITTVDDNTVDRVTRLSTQSLGGYATGVDSNGSLLQGTAALGLSNTNFGMAVGYETEHTHTATTTGGGNGTVTGTAFSNVPPYVVVNYIIKL